MLSCDCNGSYPSAQRLVDNKVASRVHAKDGGLYNFAEGMPEAAGSFMGWATLASQPPVSIEAIKAFAKQVRAEGYTSCLLIAQGGSSQAPMTITKYNKGDRYHFKFHVLDNVSPVRMHALTHNLDFEKTLVLVSSKSGGTIEVRSNLSIVYRLFTEALGEDAPQHFVAITDPGTQLETRALDEGWRAVFSGEPTVGGRFSALSVFCLVPAALIGLDLDQIIEKARAAEAACSADSLDNPAIGLASFMYDSMLKGRDKFSLITPKRARTFGLWIEQLVAESVGKNGKGILPNIEFDPLVLSVDHGDRTVIPYLVETPLDDERENFQRGLGRIDPAYPRRTYEVTDMTDLFAHFVMWEYATAMVGWLMELNPFDQPDVALPKAATLDILKSGMPQPSFTETFLGGIDLGKVEVTCSPAVAADNLHDALYNLFASIKPGDYFAFDAFVPFTGDNRREALEGIRHLVASELNVVSCLELGPRYLHSTGQLQKGGTNNGVFLVVSTGEIDDIPLEGLEAASLGELAKAQAAGDTSILIDRGRRVVHLHLPDNAGITLRLLEKAVTDIVFELKSGIRTGIWNA